METSPDHDPVQQRLDALARANRTRAARAKTKQRIAAGELSCADLILRPGWEIERMPIAKLLTSQRNWGDQRCRTVLRRVKISAIKPIGSMTKRERRILAEALHAHPGHAAPHARQRAPA